MPWCLWTCLAWALAGCEQRTEVDVLEPGPGLQFRLVEVVRPGYNVSHDYVVICRSRYTGSAPREDDVPRGAALVGRFSRGDALQMGARGGSPLHEAQAAARTALHTGSGWMAFHTRKSLRVSADRCRTWVEFVPARHLQPREAERSKGLGCSDAPCLESVLAGAGWQYRDLEFTPGAEAARHRVRFVMESIALLHSAGLDVATEDGGRTWRVTPRAGPPPAAPFEPSPGRYAEPKR